MSGSADAAIVLGSTPYWGSEWNQCLQARVTKSVELYKQGKVKAIIVSGGKDPDGTITEAEVMKEMAVAAGMDPKYIFLEEKATSTEENIRYSKAFLDYYQADSVVIVTEPYHSPRGRLVALHNLSQEVYTAPATASPCWTTYRYVHKNVWREPIVMLYYLLSGKI